jgi:hypothetical protein
VLHIAGLPLDSEEVSWLVNELIGAANEYSIEAARVLQRAASDEIVIVALTPANRAAILSVLDDPPDSLVRLRLKLEREKTDGGSDGLSA